MPCDRSLCVSKAYPIELLPCFLLPEFALNISPVLKAGAPAPVPHFSRSSQRGLSPFHITALLTLGEGPQLYVVALRLLQKGMDLAQVPPSLTRHTPAHSTGPSVQKVLFRSSLPPARPHPFRRLFTRPAPCSSHLSSRAISLRGRLSHATPILSHTSAALSTTGIQWGLVCALVHLSSPRLCVLLGAQESCTSCFLLYPWYPDSAGQVDA